jgi:predicted dehydrogenase
MICYCLGEFQALSAVVAIQHPRPVVEETGQVVENSSPDQVAIAGILESGAVVSVHTQAGTMNGTGFQLEINGTDGDLQITSTGKFANIGPQASELLLRGRQRTAKPAISEAGTLSGDTGAAALDLLALPEERLPAYLANIPAGPARNVAQLYLELANAIENDRDTTVGFDLGVRRHRLLDIIQSASDTGQRKSIID